MSRVVLVGLPGVGKTTVGRALAAALSVPFVDVDDLVEAGCGSSAASVIRDRGVAAFRALEVVALREAVGRGDVVVATGGGIVEEPVARDVLAGELVVWLTAPVATVLERLGGVERPLVEGDAAARLSELAERRAPLYAQVAGATVEVAGTVEGAVDALRAVVSVP